MKAVLMKLSAKKQPLPKGPTERLIAIGSIRQRKDGRFNGRYLLLTTTQLDHHG